MPAALDAIFLYQIWQTAQQAYICTWGNCPPPKIWSYACLAAVVGGVFEVIDYLIWISLRYLFWF